ncbi:MAG: preprotein translocase subunit YajC [Oscillospiraceae bacterium]|nr:preprotein translocase subunit YajC [Oscillospiraceae bacterium]MBQ8669731.1 preprotein translocase subunit YajC [Oscillospiraceae bacterium]MBQ9109673.1 preprotein translocase subunit YajC [Oscillospiraceae bacterium]
MFQILTDAGAASTGDMLASFLPLVLIIVFFYFFLIRPQRKRDKETQQMRNSIEVGDEIVSIGGIIGTVVSIREDMLVIETGGDRCKIRLARWAVQQNNSAAEASKK